MLLASPKQRSASVIRSCFEPNQWFHHLSFLSPVNWTVVGFFLVSLLLMLMVVHDGELPFKGIPKRVPHEIWISVVFRFCTAILKDVA